MPGTLELLKPKDEKHAPHFLLIQGFNFSKVTTMDVRDQFGEITSPGYPRFMQQANYQWTFRPSFEHSNVILYFENIDLRRSIGGG